MTQESEKPETQTPESNQGSGPQIISLDEAKESAPTAGLGAPPAPAFNLAHANETQEKLIDFRDAVQAAQFKGREAQAVSIGLMLIENMIGQGKAQIQFFQNQEILAKKKANQPQKAEKAPNAANPGA